MKSLFCFMSLNEIYWKMILLNLTLIISHEIVQIFELFIFSSFESAREWMRCSGKSIREIFRSPYPFQSVLTIEKQLTHFMFALSTSENDKINSRATEFNFFILDLTEFLIAAKISHQDIFRDSCSASWFLNAEKKDKKVKF